MNVSPKKLNFYEFTCETMPPKLEMSNPYQVLAFKPSIMKLKLHPGGLLIYLFWYLFTKGRYRIYYVKDGNNEIIHYSHVLPNFFKFPFMRSNDLEIGPCWTNESYRGQNIYPYIITLILKNLCRKNRTFYMFTEEENIPSQKGILKAGFHFYKTGFKKGILGIYNFNNN